MGVWDWERRGNTELCLGSVELEVTEGHCGEDALSPSHGLDQNFYVVVIYLFFQELYIGSQLCTKGCTYRRNPGGKRVSLWVSFLGEWGVRMTVPGVKSCWMTNGSRSKWREPPRKQRKRLKMHREHWVRGEESFQERRVFRSLTSIGIEHGF